MASRPEQYRRFCELLRADQRGQKIIERLQRCDSRVIFTAVVAYLENSPRLNDEARQREQAYRKFLRGQMRSAKTDAERASILEQQNHCDEAFQLKRKGLAHLVESLVWLESYVLARTQNRIRPRDLCAVINAVKIALNQRQVNFQQNPGDEVATLRKELARFRRKNPLYMHLLAREFTQQQ